MTLRMVRWSKEAPRLKNEISKDEEAVIEENDSKSPKERREAEEPWETHHTKMEWQTLRWMHQTKKSETKSMITIHAIIGVGLRQYFIYQKPYKKNPGKPIWKRERLQFYVFFTIAFFSDKKNQFLSICSEVQGRLHVYYKNDNGFENALYYLRVMCYLLTRNLCTVPVKIKIIYLKSISIGHISVRMEEKVYR